MHLWAKFEPKGREREAKKDAQDASWQNNCFKGTYVGQKNKGADGEGKGSEPRNIRQKGLGGSRGRWE